jgi:ABC-type Mn2+/Zn2+ transport system ATPase subunit
MKITIREDFRGLRQGNTYEFDKGFPTLIVGGNGTGKTSLLTALRHLKSDLKSNILIPSDVKDKVDVEFDYEKIFFYDKVNEDPNNFTISYDAVEYMTSGGFATKEASHGEKSFMLLDKFLRDIKDDIVPERTLIVLDEIDTGFSLESKTKYVNILNALISHYKCEVIAVTHDPITMIKNFIVYDFEKMDYVASRGYVQEKTGLNLELDTKTNSNNVLYDKFKSRFAKTIATCADLNVTQRPMTDEQYSYITDLVKDIARELNK